MRAHSGRNRLGEALQVVRYKYNNRNCLRLYDGPSFGALVCDTRLLSDQPLTVVNQADLTSQSVTLICTMPTDEAPQFLLRMAMNEGMCNATCPHCGAFNVILGLTSVDSFTCHECGEGVSVTRPIQ